MKKQDIFHTALALIVTQGLHATPMSQIAREAKVAAGTIYHYFSSKEDMINELYRDIRDELEQQMTWDDLELENYKTEFSSLCLKVFKYLIQNPLKYYFLQQYENSPLGFGSDELNRNAEYPIPPGFFEWGYEHDLISALPVNLMSNLVYNAITSMVKLQLSNRISLNRVMIQSAIDGCWNMITP